MRTKIIPLDNLFKRSFVNAETQGLRNVAFFAGDFILLQESFSPKLSLILELRVVQLAITVGIL